MTLQKRETNLLVLILCVLAIIVSVDSPAQDKGKGGASEAISQLYAAAKKEGTVVIWGPTDAIVYQRMQEVLDQQYPGIKIEHFESIPEPLVQRIIAESQAGRCGYHSIRVAARAAAFDRSRHASRFSGMGKGFWP